MCSRVELLQTRPLHVHKVCNVQAIENQAGQRQTLHTTQALHVHDPGVPHTQELEQVRPQTHWYTSPRPIAQHQLRSEGDHQTKGARDGYHGGEDAGEVGLKDLTCSGDSFDQHRVGSAAAVGLAGFKGTVVGGFKGSHLLQAHLVPTGHDVEPRGVVLEVYALHDTHHLRRVAPRAQDHGSPAWPGPLQEAGVTLLHAIPPTQVHKPQEDCYQAGSEGIQESLEHASVRLGVLYLE